MEKFLSLENKFSAKKKILLFNPFSFLINKNKKEANKDKIIVFNEEKILEPQDNNSKLENMGLLSSLKELESPQFTFSLSPIEFFLNLKSYYKEKKNFKMKYKEYEISFRDTLFKSNKTEVESYKETDRSLKINDKFKRIYYLANLPNYTFPGIFFKLINSSIPMNISIHVKETSVSSMIKAARNTKAVLYAEVENRERNGKNMSKDLQIQIEQAEEFEDKIVRGEEKAFLVSIYISIDASSDIELKDLHNQFKNLTEESQLNFNTYTYGQLDAFKSLLPLVNDSIKKDYVMQTTLVSYLMPFLTRNINDPEGIFLGKSTTNGQLVFFDLFKARNANINIFGTSGSGKSVASKLLANRLWLRHTQILVLDPEGEYSKLAHETGGVVIKFNRENGINPFFINTQNESYKKDHIQTLKTFFKFFISSENYNQAVLDEALTSLYKLKVPNLNALLRRLKNSPMARDLNVLKQGSLSGIFNSNKVLNLDNDLIIFDLSDLESEEKKKPAMFLLASILSKIVKKADRKRMIFIDEAHLFLKDKQIANFYLTLVKTARKYKTGIVSITQNVEDYYNDEYKVGQGIITNAETTLLLKQSFASLKFLNQTYSLTDPEQNILPTFNVGEALLFREREHMRIDVVPLTSEYKFINT